MKTIRAALEDILANDEHIAHCFDRGLLNLSALAKNLGDRVCEETAQSVPLNTIVAALSRMQKHREIKEVEPTRLHASDLSVKTGLCAIAYEKTEKAQALLPKVTSQGQLTSGELFVITVGLSQISFVLPAAQVSELRNGLKGLKPITTSNNLAAVTIRFTQEYLKTPGIVHYFIRAISARGINIIEVVSTCTELTVIVREEHLEATFLAWHRCIAEDKRGRTSK